MDVLWRDVRIGLRQLGRSRGFTLATIFALTLGIGATSAMVTVTEGVLLQTLPYDEPDRIVLLTGTLDQGADQEDAPISYPDFADWRERAESFESLAAFTTEPFSFNLLGEQDAERVSVEFVSAAYFPLLGMEPAVGRFFTPEEDRELLAHPVVVLSHSFWSRRFGADPGVIGRTLDLSHKSYQVVGVAEEGFDGLTDDAEIFFPVMMPPGPDYIKLRRFRWLSAVGRLAPGVSPRQAESEMAALTAGLEAEHPEENEGIGVRLEVLKEAWFGKLRYGLFFLLGGASILLVIACINVANLLLVRAVERQRTIAIRTALGADRWRLVRQLLTESALLALIGCALGLALASWATRLLVVASRVDFKSFTEIAVDPFVVAVSVAVALACGLVFGLVPVWVTLKSDLSKTLQQEGRSPGREAGRQRFQGAVVVAQVALTLVLLVASGLMARAYGRLMDQDLGFEPENLLTLRLDLKGDKYARDEPVFQLVRGALEQIGAQPGVRSVAMVGPNIPTDDWAGGYSTIEEYVSPSPDGTILVLLHSVSPGYFSTLGVPITDGRALGFEDTREAPFAVVVSREMAERYWPGESPVGKRLKFGSRAAERPWFTVVGVADHVEHSGLLGRERPGPDLYLSLLQFPVRLPNVLNVLVRPEDGYKASALVPGVRAALDRIAPDFPAYDVATMEERLLEQSAQGRFQVLLIGLFTLIALVLSAIGIYGVIAYGVTQRTREIGVRMALGAERRDLIRLVVGRGALLAGAGLLFGLAVSLLFGRLLSSLLYGASATDPLILAGASAFLLAVALSASYFPARRAARLDPAVSLREE